MCKNSKEGPRCAGHTRGPAEAALRIMHEQGPNMLTEEQVQDIVDFAATRTGRPEVALLAQQVGEEGDAQFESSLISILQQADDRAASDVEFRALRRQLDDLPENHLLNSESPLSDEAREIMMDLDYFQQQDVVRTGYDLAYNAVKRGDMVNPGKDGEKQAEIDRLRAEYPDMMAAYDRGKKDPTTEITAAEWEQMVEHDIEKFNRRVNDPQAAALLEAAKKEVPRNLAEARALLGLHYRTSGAVSRLSREYRQIAGLHQVSPEIVSEQFEAIRQEYLALPEDQRPEVPTDHQNAVEASYWGGSKHKRPPMDPASAYALYALTHEPERLAPFRQSGEYVVFDTETTGIGNKDKVLEVAAIVYDSEGNEKERFRTYIHPGTEADGTIFLGGDSARAVHGITEQHLEGAPSEAEVAERLSKIMAGRTIVGHNVEFDYRMVNSLLGRSGQPALPQPPMVDTIRLARYIQPRPPGMKASEFSHRLQNCCERAGIGFDPDKAHGAEYDTERAAELFFALRPRLLGGAMSTSAAG